MRILGVDTATTGASAALVEDGRVIAQEIIQRGAGGGTTAKGNHAEILLDLVQTVLHRGAASLSELSAVAVTIGPGSFTGLRISLATAKGIAYAAGLPLGAISTLHATAATVSGDFEGIVCAMLDARKTEVYTAIFLRRDGQLIRQSADQCVSLDQCLAQLRQFGNDQPLVLVGDGTARYRETLRRQLAGDGRIAAVAGGECIAAQAAILAGADRGSWIASSALGALVPAYLRASSARPQELRETSASGD
jgi:tRNA threonylcarbamoyladenosine biosynthesis protein TsaB